MSSTSRQPHRRHHHQNFPPQHYTDLRGSDISLLAPIFGPSPSRTSPTYDTHETAIRKKISELPSHLRSKISLLSSCCSLHKQLNSLPITSILSVIQEEVTPQALFHWAPVERSSWLDVKTLALLEEMNTIWQSPSTFQHNFGRAPTPTTRWNFVNHKCAACKLTEIANNVPALVALGACIIARLDPANWKKSKRIQWMEAWIAVSVESGNSIESVTKAMWECGVKLRNAMGQEETPPRPKRRDYIDEFVAQARTPQRPTRSETQYGHVEFVAERESRAGDGDEGEESDAESVKTIRQETPSPRPPPAASSTETAAPSPQTPAPSTQTPPSLPTRYVPSTDFFARVQQSFHENDMETLLRPATRTPSAPRRPTSSQPARPRVASSIYSRATNEDDEHIRWDSQENWFRSSVLEESEFIDSYNRPAGSENGGIRPTPDERGFI